MPYITKEERKDLENWFDPIEFSAGQLNYSITLLLDDWVGDDPNYDILQDAIGAIEVLKSRLEHSQELIQHGDDVLTVSIADILTEWIIDHPRSRAVGTLACVKEEFYRRVVAPYEDFKRALNGDVYRHRHWS